jgi:hypothetical protein
MTRLLAWLSARLPLRVIAIEHDVYLLRYYVFGRLPERFFPNVKPRLGWFPWSVYLHHFLRPDRDRELHNHPWRWALSLVLVGGYEEDRFGDDGVVYTRRVRFASLIRHGDFHRIRRLRLHHAWSLFIAGPKVSSWGFLDPETREFTYSREFFARGRGA